MHVACASVMMMMMIIIISSSLQAWREPLILCVYSSPTYFLLLICIDVLWDRFCRAVWGLGFDGEWLRCLKVRVNIKSKIYKLPADPEEPEEIYKDL